ncbi:hypothetical protein PYJP_08260 [Pyrofollis japonicus]|nr:hypothetical protein PYJP_08260 [Pyrofollis japonicus]
MPSKPFLELIAEPLQIIAVLRGSGGVLRQILEARPLPHLHGASANIDSIWEGGG